MSTPSKWRQVATLGEIPSGKMLQVNVDEHGLLLANTGEHLFATDDLCSHEDASLSSGALHGEFVTCPLHGSRFCLRTGAAQEEPAEEPLRCYPVRVVGENIEVDFA